MVRATLATLALLISGTAFASSSVVHKVMTDWTAHMVQNAVVSNISFKVGDTAAYSLKIGSLLSGTMTMTVSSLTSTVLTIEQDTNIAGQAEKCQETINPNTGALIKLICNGQDETNQAGGNLQVEQENNQTITVAAGTFATLYIKAKDTSNNSEIELWSDDKDVPVFGMVKTNEPTQMGTADIELTSFHRN